MWRERITAWRRKVHDLDIEPVRYLNLGLASWLLISVFLWRHTEPQFLVTVLVGAVLAIVAPFDLDSPRVRKVNIAAGAALVLAAVALPHATRFGLVHNAFFGMVIAGLSFFGPPHGRVPRRLPAPDGTYDAVGM